MCDCGRIQQVVPTSITISDTTATITLPTDFKPLNGQIYDIPLSVSIPDGTNGAIITITNGTISGNLLNRLGRNNCKIVNWKQYKDANEALMAGENLQEFINNAESISPDGIIHFEDCWDEIFKFNYEQDNNYYKTGWQKLNDI